MPGNASLEDLRVSMEKLLTRLKPVNPLPRVAIDRGISVKEKIKAIMDLFKSAKKFTFSSLLSDSENRTDVIVSFLAVLDILKEQRAYIKQAENFGDMEIVRI